MASIDISMASWSLTDFWIRIENQKCKYCIRGKLRINHAEVAYNIIWEKDVSISRLWDSIYELCILTPKSTLVRGNL